MEVLKSKRGLKLVDKNVQQSELVPFYREHSPRSIQPIDFSYNSTYPIYAYLFNMGNFGVVDDVYEMVKFDNVLQRMHNYCSPLFSDFFEETRNLEWLEINALFFQYAFFGNYIYIHWSEEEQKYELYIKCGAVKSDLNEDAEINKFINIQTNEVEIFSHPEEDLVRFNWTGRDENRFNSWFNLAYKMEVKLAIYDIACMLFNKRMVVKGENYYNNTQTQLETLKKEFVNLAVFLTKSGKENLVEFIPPMMPAAELDGYITSIYKWFDREVSELGRVANLNPKKQRTTTGENYMAMDRQVDYLRGTLDRLDLMCLKMTKLGWPTLVFKINTEQGLGIQEAEEEEKEPGKSKVDKGPENV